ncbi:peptidase M14 [Bacillus sp. UMB0899]|uniref:M14 family metallopeptidase n=1 Tax=Metabacillus schmidteae TaxID=2730405 RepID=UPI000C806358|nr:M14 family metallocarboxypeptidase [Metabacillus schmidteae]PMC39621.1 peptidase M14 [Bacillus sp. UMB0899]
MIICLNKTITLKEISEKLQLDRQLIMDCNKEMNVQLEFAANTTLAVPVSCLQRIKDCSFFNIQTKGENPLFTKKPYDSDVLYEDLEKLVNIYPFIKKNVIGYSVLGKPIIEIVIGSGPKKIHMNGSFHANEWITTSIMMHWVHEYLELLCKEPLTKNMLDLYKATTLSFVPMVNPDGVDLVLNGLPDHPDYEPALLQMNDLSIDFSQWKANIRGIDLNNQYPANWEIEKKRKIPKAPAPRDYPGDAPLTEPEAVALSTLVENSGFDRVLAFHTQGEEIYWGYLRKEPDEAEHIVKEFEKLSGYKAVRDIDSHAGFRDWYVNKWRKPGFTIELGNGVNPLPFEQFDEIYKKSKGIFYSALYM